MDFIKGGSGKIVLAIAVVIGLFFFCSRKKTGAPTPAPSITSNSSSAPLKNQVELEQIPTSSPSSSNIENRRAMNKLATTGIQKIPSKVKGKFITFDIKFRMQGAGCNFGDFDTLALLEKSRSDRTYLLSVEPLHKGNGPKMSASISVDEIRTERKISFNLPRTKKAVDYAVFLCSDRSHKDSCGKKPPYQPLPWKDALRGKKIPDSIFNFQLLSVRDDAVYVHPAHDWSPKNIKTLKTSLESILETPESFDTLVKYAYALRSVPAITTSRGMDIPLPKRNPNGCR